MLPGETSLQCQKTIPTSVTAPTLGSSLDGMTPNPIPTGQEQESIWYDDR
jgi:hypothetical protein